MSRRSFYSFLAALALLPSTYSANQPFVLQLRSWRDELDRAANRFNEWRLQLEPPQLPRWPFANGGVSAKDEGDYLALVEDRASSGNGWTLKIQKDGVRVWRRPLKGCPNDEIRGNGIISASPKTVLALIRESDENVIRQVGIAHERLCARVVLALLR